MIDQVSDHRKLHYLQKKLRNMPLNEVAIFRATQFCGSKMLEFPSNNGGQNAVFVMTNGEQAQVVGINSCKNSWYCPVCSPKLMSKYASEIGALITALKEQKQVAVMVTLTVVHTSGMSCEETTEILYNTWKQFITHGNKNQNSKWYRKVDGKKILVKGQNKLKDPFATFCEETNSKHRVRVGEFTWGKHGWHPHFHCLFWVDKDKFDKVQDWELPLRERWIELSKRETLKYWNKIYPDKKDDNKKRLEIMYQNCDSKNSHGLFMSKDKLGNVRIAEESNYICGWGADKEITSNVANKATAEDHYSPAEILENACSPKIQDNKFWWDLYFQYMYATRKKSHRRINFSLGARKILNAWKQTNAFIEFCKKKRLQDQRADWRVLCWFSKQQWSTISRLNESCPIIHNILFLASLDRRDLIEYYLELYDIKLSDMRHPLTEYYENLYNDKLSKEYTSETEECA